MSKFKKISALLLGISMVLTGCGNPGPASESESIGGLEVDKSLVFGMTDLSYQEEGTDYRYTHRLFKNMGVKSVRLWMHCDWFMNSPSEYSTSGLAKMRAIYNDIKDEGYQIIAMNHSNFHATGMINSGSTTAKPARDLTEGSYYMQWLNDLETTYYNMVMAFPDIQYWEIDNECNNDDFMPRLGGGLFSLEEKAQIYYDMMYFASRGIHRANPNAITVMGGLVTWNITTFLNYIYDLIESKDSWSNNTDDYFQVACWHPYMDYFSKNKFINENNAIYDIVKQREGRDKKVFLTEMGFSEGKGHRVDDQAQYIKDIYSACRDDLYYVESLHYFRMYDDYSSTWGSDAEKTFGLFYDPVDYKMVDGVKTKDLAEPKPGAIAFQEIAQGSGDLNVYRDFLKGNYETKLVMHAGYSTKARENTIESFTLAGQLPEMYAIETDIYLTKDNVPVCIHDNNTKRVTLNRYNVDVNESTFEELRKVKLTDMKGNPDVHVIPSMDEYLDIVKQYNKVAFIEFKENFNEQELKILMDAILAKLDLSQVMIISFHKEALIKLREMYSDVKITLLLNYYSDVNVNELTQHNFGLGIDVNGITDAEVDEFLLTGIEIDIWTVDDKNIAHKYGRKGVNYITTNSIESFKD